MPGGTISDGNAGVAKTVLFAIFTIALLIVKITYDWKKAGQSCRSRQKV